MKNVFLALLFSISALSLFGQITANGNSGTSSTVYTDGSANESIYIWSSGTLATNAGSLTATPPSGTGPWTFEWFYHDQTTFSWVAYSTSTGSTSTISSLASDGYRVQITDNSGTLVGCYNAWVWNLNGSTSIAQGAMTCSSTNLTGTAASNGTFTYYNPPEARSTVSASTGVSVSFSATHTYVSDLVFYLKGPASCGSPTVTLSSLRYICNSGNNVSNLVFSTASTSVLDICTASVPLTGTFGKYKTDGGSTVNIDWSLIYGCNAASGGWSIQIFDCTGADVGTLTNAKVVFTGLTSFCGSPTNLTYDSGVISSAINDNSCTAGSASVFQVPPSSAYTTPIVASASTTYLWTASPAITFPSSTTGSLTQNITGLAAGSSTTFTLTETISYGAFSTTYNATNTFTAPSSPTATAGGTQTICANGTATVSGATSSNGTIAWTENGAGSITSGATTLTPVYTAAAGDAGNTVTLTMTVTSNATCTPKPAPATATYTVVVNTTAAITSQSTAAQTKCQGAAFSAISVTASGTGITYQWYSNTTASNSGGTSLAPDGQTASYTPSSATAGTLYYYCIVTGSCGSATSSVSGAFLVKPLPTSSAGGTSTICQNGTATVSGASVSNGTVLWTENGAGSITSGGTTLTPVYTAAAGDAGNTVTLTMATTSTNGCANPANVTYSVIVNPLSTASAGGSQTICQNGTATVSGANSANGTIAWTENGAGSITSGGTTLTPVYTASAGDAGSTVTLTMTVTSSNACASPAPVSYSVIVNALPTASAGGTSTICQNGTATVSGASSSNGTIAWTENGAGSITSGATTLTPVYTAAAGDAGNTVTLTMTVTSSNTCAPQTATATYTVVVEPLPTASAGGTQTICQNGTATVSGASSTNGTIAWTENGAGSITSGSTSLTPVYTAAAGDAGNTVTLTMTVTSTNSCSPQVATATYTVVVNPLPTATAGGTTTICSNESTTVSGANAANGTIAWTENGAGTITSGATTLTPVYAAAVGDAGNIVTLTMTVTSNNVCTPQTTTATYTINIDQLPTASAGGSQTICQNGTATVSGASSANGTILWTHNGSGTISNATTLTPTYTAAASDAGNTVTLTMSVTTTATCTPIPAPATATYTVVVNPLPTAIAGGSQTICQNGTATVSGASSTNGTIAWTENGAGTITSGSATLTPTYTAAAGDAGNNITLTMTVTSTNACGPQTAIASYSVIVNSLPTASAGGSQTICENGTATVSGASAANGTIVWTENGVGTITSGATTLTPVYTAAASDVGNTVTLTMTVTSNNTCTPATATANYSVVVNPLPTASAGGTQTICQNGTATVSGASATNGSISWVENGAGSITSGATTLTPVYTAAAGDAGNTVTLTMTITSNNACSPQSVTASYSVIVNPLPAATAGGTQTICVSSTGTVSGASASNGTIAWTENGAGSITSGATTLTPTYTPAISDSSTLVTLTMTVTSSNACGPQVETANYIFDIDPMPTANASATAGGTQTICQNATATVSGASASNGTIVWTENGAGSITSGATTLTPTYTAAAGDAGNTVNLLLTVTSNNACNPSTATAIYTVVVNPLPTSTSGGSQTICQNATATVSGASASNGTIVWTENGAGSITSGSTSLTPIYAAAAGDAGNTVTLTMTVTSNNVCGSQVSSASYLVHVNPLPTYTITSTNPTVCSGNDGAIVIQGLNNTDTYYVEYFDDGILTLMSSNAIPNTSGNVVISNLNEGVYNQFNVVLNGCSTIQGTQTLISPSAPVLDAISNVEVCDKYQLPVITGQNLISPAYYTGPNKTGTMYSPTDEISSSVTLYVYDNNNTCSDEIMFNVTINPLPTATISASQLVVCKNSTQPQVTLTGATGTAPYTFTYNVNGGATQTVTSSSGNSVVLNVPTTIVGSFTYNLIDVTDASSTSCSNTQTGSVSITVNALPTASISGSTSICAGQTTPIVFNGTPNSIVSYSFNNGITQTIALNSSGNANLTSSALSNDGTYTLLSVATTATPSCSQTQSGAANIVVVSYPVNPTVSSDVTYCLGEPIADMTASSNSGGALIWYADANLTDSLGVGTNFKPEAKTAIFYITEMTPYPFCESSPSAISILVQDCEIVLPTAFTPDGDMVNDTWVIENLDAIYPKSIVRIYNRWGNIVFESKEGIYEQDPWNGKFNTEDLPVASYYFSIEYNDGKHDPKKGTVTIIRK